MPVPVTKTRHRLFVPEVIQTSAMDCGPAALKCLLEGFGLPVSYGRLREACQTNVDGTSIDTLEEVAIQLGLEAEQIMIPADHVLLPEARALPALIVVRLPDGATHFIVAWRRHGRFVQVMDPATGRCWLTGKRFLDELYVHVMPVPAEAWRDWAGSDGFLNPLRRRLADLGVARPVMDQLVDVARANPSWHSLASLDAATRMVGAIARSGGLRGHQAAHVLGSFFDRTQQEAAQATETVPDTYWSVRPAPPDAAGETQLFLRGAVLVRVLGRRAVSRLAPDEEAGAIGEVLPPLSPELVAALEEPPSRPGRELLRLLRTDGLLAPSVLMALLLLAAAGVVVEALLFRGLLDLGRLLGLGGSRLWVMGVILSFVAGLLLIRFPLTAGLIRSGRHLETRLRVAFLSKIPAIGDHYFHSRLTSDMAERSHSLHRIRQLPSLGGQLIELVFKLILTAAGLIWLNPAGAPMTVVAALLIVGLTFVAQPLLTERDLRIRTHTGALSRFYLDALLGLVAIRTHGAERAVRREHESLLVEWAGSRFGFYRAMLVVDGIQVLVGFGLTIWLLFDYLARGGATSGVLLLVYWAIDLFSLGHETARVARQYPTHRNVTLRLLEPLSTPTEGPGTSDAAASHPVSAAAESSRGVALRMEGVGVRVAGHTILEGIDVAIEAGSHVAIVGPSGAGKSTLVGTLLGWYQPASGQILVDEVPLDGRCLERLRRETAWVDPAVQIWNRSLLDNLCYSVALDPHLPIDRIIERADLYSVLEDLPDGLQTPLGEGGGLVSGGEGQRVRLGRAMFRSEARLVIFDEPFSGLDRGQRREFLVRARKLWPDATFLCVTHDVGETQAFERVLVIEGGRIVQDGSPADLAQQPGSRYRAMLEAEVAVRQDLWSSGNWRRLWLEEGRLQETSKREGP